MTSIYRREVSCLLHLCISSFWQNGWQIIYIDKYLTKGKLFKSMKDAILDIFVLDVSHNHSAVF